MYIELIRFSFTSDIKEISTERVSISMMTSPMLNSCLQYETTHLNAYLNVKQTRFWISIVVVFY